MKYSSSVKAILLASINELADNPDLYPKHPGRDFTRNRKLGFKDFLILLLTMEAECIKEELYRYFGRETSAPSKAAFCKQRSKLRQDALRNLLFAFNAKLKRNLYNGKYQFIACDGSACDIFRNPKDPDTFFEPNGKSKRGFNQIHINAFFSILDRRFTDLVIQPGRKRNEYAAFCHMVDSAGSAGPKTVYFADMGYASYNNFAHVIENGQYFLIRCDPKKTKGILGRPLEEIKELDCRVERILTRSRAKRKRLQPDRPDDYRQVCKEVAMDFLTDENPEYEISLRVVRFDFSEGYPLCLKAFHSKKYEYIVQEVWARAILHNFSSEIIQNVGIENRDTQYRYQANFSEGFKTCRDFLRIHDGQTSLDVKGLIAQNIGPIRPGRTFTRQQRFKLPISFCYRN